MPTKIRIDDLEILRSAAAEKDQIIAELEEMVAALQAISAGAPSYDGQFAPRIKDLGAMEMAQIQGIIQRERESASYLRMKADAFERAEEANLEGLAGLHAALWESVDRFGDASLMPLYLLRGSKPPHTSDLEWWRLTPYERETYLESLRLEWARFLAGRSVSQVHAVRPTRELLEEEFQIYLFGLPKGFGPVEKPLSALPEYPAASFDADHGVAQYFPVTFLGENFPKPLNHYNLCGLLSIGHIMNGSYENVIGTFRDLRTTVSWVEEVDGQEVVKTSASGGDMLRHNAGASLANLEDLLKDYGWEAETIGKYESDPLWWHENDRTLDATAAHVAAYLDEGKTIIPLINLEGHAAAVNHGFLEANYPTDGGPHKRTNHFVEILEVFPTRDGSQVVRVFNPFYNREEFYTWDHFSRAWDGPGVGEFRAVVASQPSPDP